MNADGARTPTARRVAVAGAVGQMGANVCRVVREAADLELVAAVDPRCSPDVHRASGGAPCFEALDAALAALVVDVVVDFTRPESVVGNVRTCLSRRVPVVVGTSGISRRDLDALAEEAAASGGTVFIAPNFALGAVLMMQFARQAARQLRSCEIVELHHDRKLDAPSGTARRTAELVEEVWRADGVERTVPIHSVRLPGLVAHQEVILGGTGETLTIRHDSLSRDSFMPGVLLAIRRIDAVQGLVLGLENLL